MAAAQPDSAQVSETDKPGGKKKLLFIVAAVAVLLFAGGAAALLLFGGEKTAADGEEATVAAVEEPGEPTYFKLDPEFVVNLPPGGKARLLQVGLEVYTTDPELAEILDRHAPMLRHHLFDVLSAQPGDGLFTRAGREELQRALQAELQHKLAEVGEADAQIKAVYFTQFVLQ